MNHKQIYQLACHHKCTAYQHLCHFNEDEPEANISTHVPPQVHSISTPMSFHDVSCTWTINKYINSRATTSAQRINTYVTSMKMNHEERTVKNVITHPPPPRKPTQPTPKISTPMSLQRRWTIKDLVEHLHVTRTKWFFSGALRKPEAEQSPRLCDQLRSKHPSRGGPLYWPRQLKPLLQPVSRCKTRQPTPAQMAKTSPWAPSSSTAPPPPRPRHPASLYDLEGAPLALDLCQNPSGPALGEAVRATPDPPFRPSCGKKERPGKKTTTTPSCKTTSMYETHAQKMKICQVSGAPSPRVTNNKSNFGSRTPAWNARPNQTSKQNTGEGCQIECQNRCWKKNPNRCHIEHHKKYGDKMAEKMPERRQDTRIKCRNKC